MYDPTINSKEQFISKFKQYFERDVDNNLKKWKKIIEEHPDQVMWGMDRGYSWHFDEEVGGLLVEYSRAFIGGLDPEVQEKYAYKNAEQMLSQSEKSVSVETTIPAWIKNNAGWWADGVIDDSSFVQGIQFLIKEGIMEIPPTTQGSSSETNEIPAWIKNNAGWWADGVIDDSSFVQGIQFLVEKRILNVD
jgi:hypothetical protein